MIYNKWANKCMPISSLRSLRFLMTLREQPQWLQGKCIKITFQWQSLVKLGLHPRFSRQDWTELYTHPTLVLKSFIIIIDVQYLRDYISFSYFNKWSNKSKKCISIKLHLEKCWDNILFKAYLFINSTDIYWVSYWALPGFVGPEAYKIEG